MRRGRVEQQVAPCQGAPDAFEALAGPIIAERDAREHSDPPVSEVEEMICHGLCGRSIRKADIWVRRGRIESPAGDERDRGASQHRQNVLGVIIADEENSVGSALEQTPQVRDLRRSIVFRYGDEERIVRGLQAPLEGVYACREYGAVQRRYNRSDGVGAPRGEGARGPVRKIPKPLNGPFYARPNLLRHQRRVVQQTRDRGGRHTGGHRDVGLGRTATGVACHAGKQDSEEVDNRRGCRETIIVSAYIRDDDEYLKDLNVAVVYLKTCEKTAASGEDDVRGTVQSILDEIEAGGEDAAIACAARLDKWDGEIVVTEIARRAAAESVPERLKDDIQFAHDQVRRFAQAQREAIRDTEVELRPGLVAGHRNLPISVAGCYVPGGRYSHVASAIMSVTTAKVAGVPNVIACSPPRPGIGISPALLYTLNLCGADTILNLGGVPGQSNEF